MRLLLSYQRNDNYDNKTFNYQDNAIRTLAMVARLHVKLYYGNLSISPLKNTISK